MKRTSVAEQRKHQAMADVRELRFVHGQPGDRSDRGRGEHETVRVACRWVRKERSKLHRDSESGQVVVGERRMAVVSEYQHFVLACSAVNVFGQGQAARAELRADDDAVT